ncbi:MAG: RNA polymerase sigma factor [Deltaproteobacteria bacterium]|nr:RNA polymerase sigma factor [Deltaproteobacteria bacterium]
MLTPATLSSGLTLSDEDVVARVLRGERELFEILMRRHNRRVFRTARAVVSNDAEAEDVMQEAYVRAFEALPRFEGRSSFATWLTRIVINEGLTRRRRAPAGRFGDLEEADAMSDPEQASPERRTFDRELRELLEHAVEALSEPFRLVFVLRAVEQLSVREVSESLGIPEETVKTRYFRARAQLRESLEEHADAAAPGLYEFHLVRCDRVVDAVMKRLPGRDP